MTATSSAKSTVKNAANAAKATTKAASNAIESAGNTLSFASNNPNEYTWEELLAIEKRRRAILQRVEESRWGILSHWDGTVLNILLKDTLFYVTVVFYIAMRVWARIGIPDYVADLGSGDIAAIGGFLSFFLVFYVNQSNARYFGLYNKSMACKGRIFDVATIVVATLPKEVATRIIRYMNAAHVAGYTGLSKTYCSSSFFSQLNKNFGLLTKEELSRLQNIDLDAGGSCQRECIAWAMNDIQDQYRKRIIDAELANQLREQLLQLRAAFGALFNAADLPVPFFYVHFICLLSTLYLPLFAITAGYKAGSGSDVYWTADVVAGLVVVLQSIFVIGLRILGQKMNDPYGDDLEDLSVIFYCTFTWRMSNRILNARFPPEEPSELVEEKLIKNRVDGIGSAFESPDSSDATASNTDEDDVDQDGLPINQMADGEAFGEGKQPSSRFRRIGRRD